VAGLLLATALRFLVKIARVLIGKELYCAATLVQLLSLGIQGTLFFKKESEMHNSQFGASLDRVFPGAIIMFSIAAFGQQPIAPVNQGAVPAASTQTHSASGRNQTMNGMEMTNIPYFSESNGMRSVLTLNNNTPTVSMSRLRYSIVKARL
jgi:hypothetical protein